MTSSVMLYISWLGRVFVKDFNDSALNNIEAYIEDLRKNANVNMASFKDEFEDLLIKFLRSDVLIAISGRVEPKARVV